VICKVNCISLNNTCFDGGKDFTNYIVYCGIGITINCINASPTYALVMHCGEWWVM